MKAPSPSPRSDRRSGNGSSRLDTERPSSLAQKDLVAPRALDEETIALVRRQIGIPISRSPRHHNEVSSIDSFRHFAQGYGDDNRLYCDPDYAKASSWGSPIAPPLYPYSAGINRPTAWTDGEKNIMRAGDPLRAIGQYMCGDRWVFFKPVQPGDVLYRSQALHSAELKTSSFGGGSGALLSHLVRWEDSAGSPYVYRFLDYWHADRDRTRKAAKYVTIDRTRYNDEDTERIDSLYEGEVVRGSTPRFARDVVVGEELGPIVKGPLSVTDIICWHSGTGFGEFGVGALKLGYKNRKRIPGFYQRTEFGNWDAAMRAHWDQAWAEHLGQPAPYDYGVMRSNWMVHLVTNWMGDDAWIWKLSSAVRKFNYIGDTHLVSGVVAEVDRQKNLVTINLSATNQRGEVTCAGQAVVAMPSPDGGAATLPDFDPSEVPEASWP
jgi:acyl dehydratase